MNSELNNIICSFIQNIGTIPFETEEQREEHASKVAETILELKDNKKLSNTWQYYDYEIETTANMIQKIYTKKR